jgi:hypothetical protein
VFYKFTVETPTFFDHVKITKKTGKLDAMINFDMKYKDEANAWHDCPGTPYHYPESDGIGPKAFACKSPVKAKQIQLISKDKTFMCMGEVEIYVNTIGPGPELNVWRLDSSATKVEVDRCPIGTWRGLNKELDSSNSNDLQNIPACASCPATKTTTVDYAMANDNTANSVCTEDCPTGSTCDGVNGEVKAASPTCTAGCQTCPSGAWTRTTIDQDDQSPLCPDGHWYKVSTGWDGSGKSIRGCCPCEKGQYLNIQDQILLPIFP